MIIFLALKDEAECLDYMKKIKKISIEDAENIFVKCMCYLLSFISVPIILNYLGIEKNGLWNTILSILSWVGFFDVGIGNGLRNYLTENLKKDKEKCKKIVSSGYVMLSIVMFMFFSFFFIVSLFVNWNKVLGVSFVDENLGNIVRLSVFLLAINFVFSLVRSVLFALQKAVVVNFIELLTQLLNLFLLFIVRRLFDSSVLAVCFIYGLAMIVVNFGAGIIVFSKEKYLSPNLRFYDLLIGKKILGIGLKFFVIQICALVLFTTDNIIISVLYGAAKVTPYSLLLKAFSVIIGMHSALISPLWSLVTKYKVENRIALMKKELIKYTILIIPFVCGSIVFGLIFRKVSNLWTGMVLPYDSLLIILGVIYCILSLWCNMWACFTNGIQLLRFSIIVASIQAIINIPLSLFFSVIIDLKSAGVLLGTIVSMIIAAILGPIRVILWMKGDSNGLYTYIQTKFIGK